MNKENRKRIAYFAAIIERKLYGNLIGKKVLPLFFLSDLAFIKENTFRLYGDLSENRLYVCSHNFWNTGPIPIIFGSLKPQKIELSFFLGIAMLPVI